MRALSHNLRSNNRQGKPGAVVDYLKTAPFGGLFTVTFIVAATFQVTMSLLGVVMAFTAPGMFHMNGATAANPGQAIGTLLFLLAFGLMMNAAMSALGAGIWLFLRRFLPNTKPASV